MQYQNRSILIRAAFEGYKNIPYILNRTATTHIKRQLISGDNSYQFEKATTHIKRQLISYVEIENSYQVLTDANLQSINSSLQERLSQLDCTLVAINTITPNER